MSDPCSPQALGGEGTWESFGPGGATALSSVMLEWVTALQQVIREVSSSSNN